MAQMVKCLSTIWEIWVQSLGREDSLEKEMATHSSCLENPMDRGAWCRLLPMGSQRVGHNWATSLYLSKEWSFFLTIRSSRRDRKDLNNHNITSYCKEERKALFKKDAKHKAFCWVKNIAVEALKLLNICRKFPFIWDLLCNSVFH